MQLDVEQVVLLMGVPTIQSPGKIHQGLVGCLLVNLLVYYFVISPDDVLQCMHQLVAVFAFSILFSIDSMILWSRYCSGSKSESISYNLEIIVVSWDSA